MRLSKVIFSRPKASLTLVSDSSVEDYPAMSALVLFYARFARSARKILITSPEGCEVVDSPDVTKMIHQKARSISTSLRSISLRFSRSPQVPDGFEILPSLGEKYVILNPRTGDKLDHGHDSNDRPPHPQTFGSPAGASSRALSHLVVQSCPRRREYLVHYATEEYMRAVLDVSFFMRGLLSKEYLGRNMFESLLKYREDLAARYLGSIAPGLPLNVNESILSHSAFRSAGLSKFYPLYADPCVQEIYLDAVGTCAYVDHEVFGRLSTNIRLTPADVERLVVNLRRNTGLRLDLKVPSIKGDLITKHCVSRASVDSYPLVAGQYAVDIRKLRSTPFSLTELVNSGFITLDAASVLLTFLAHKMNISIIGEPGSGKTTLLASLDALAPTWWRRIYLEDCIEFPRHDGGNSRGVHLVVDPFEGKGSTRRKSSEIVKLLHRNPSYVILGEIQFSDHFKALFHAMAAGLRVMHTAHAVTVTDFVRRVSRVYGIPLDLVSNLDLIAFLRKEEHEQGTLRTLGSLTAVYNPDALGPPRLVSVRTNGSTFQLPEVDIAALISEVEKKRGLPRSSMTHSYEATRSILGQLSSEGETDLHVVKERVSQAFSSAST